jgi:Skp family chaperone for outer membrane proteins
MSDKFAMFPLDSVERWKAVTDRVVAERDEWQARAAKAEAEVARLKARLVTFGAMPSDEERRYYEARAALKEQGGDND